jgi:hypothetical protein
MREASQKTFFFIQSIEIFFLSAHDGKFQSITHYFESDLYQFVELDKTRWNLKGFVPICCPSEVMTVLLNFWPLAGICRKIEIPNFDLTFCPKIGLMFLRMSYKFRSKRMFSSWNVGYPKNHHALQGMSEKRVSSTFDISRKNILLGWNW